MSVSAPHDRFDRDAVGVELVSVFTASCACGDLSATDVGGGAHGMFALHVVVGRPVGEVILCAMVLDEGPHEGKGLTRV